MTDILVKRGNRGGDMHRKTAWRHREHAMWRQKERLESRCQKPREPKSGWSPPQARAAVSSTDLRGAWPSQQLGFGHLASGTVKWQISDVIISQPVSGTCYAVLVLLFGSYSVVSDSLRPRELQHTRLPCPSPSRGACSNSCPLSQWCHPTISSSVTHFSSCPQPFPASGSF